MLNERKPNIFVPKAIMAKHIIERIFDHLPQRIKEIHGRLVYLSETEKLFLFFVNVLKCLLKWCFSTVITSETALIESLMFSTYFLLKTSNVKDAVKLMALQFFWTGGTYTLIGHFVTVVTVAMVMTFQQKQLEMQTLLIEAQLFVFILSKCTLISNAIYVIVMTIIGIYLYILKYKRKSNLDSILGLIETCILYMALFDHVSFHVPQAAVLLWFGYVTLKFALHIRWILC